MHPDHQRSKGGWEARPCCSHISPHAVPSLRLQEGAVLLVVLSSDEASVDKSCSFLQNKCSKTELIQSVMYSDFQLHVASEHRPGFLMLSALAAALV